MDEKTAFRARRRSHEEMPPEPKQCRRIETEYDRNGTLQYLAAWDVHRGLVVGRCEAKTGIKPLADWWIRFWSRSLTMMGSGCSLSWIIVRVRIVVRRRWSGCIRARRKDHLGSHARYVRVGLNQVEIYFSIIQRKVLTPNDFATLDAVRLRLALYEQLSNRTPRPFAWKFTRQDLLNWLKRAAPHFLAASAA